MSKNKFNRSEVQDDSSFSPVSGQSLYLENDSGCGSDDDRTLTRKINKGLSMGYDYELIKSVIEQQNTNDGMSKFIETIVRTAELNHHSIASPSSTANDNDYSERVYIPHDVYIIDGVDLTFSDGNNSFSSRGIEICSKYLYSHRHKKVFVALPYPLKHQWYERSFSESKILRDLGRRNLLIYTDRMANNRTKQHHIVISIKC